MAPRLHPSPLAAATALTFTLLAFTFNLLAPSARAAIPTPWSAKVDSVAPLPEYPRPQLQRDAWINLNGCWDYAVRARELAVAPATFDGKILVPFAIESDLSGVKRRVGPGERLWYRRTFTAPDLAGGKRLLLNFGAVDWQADVIVNGQALGRHEGGYDAFSFDITGVLRPGREPQEIVVAVWDPTAAGAQPRGKQVQKPGGIWYTPVTGIWQTVWLEAAPGPRVAGLAFTPDLDRGNVTVRLETQGNRTDARAEIAVLADGRRIASAEITDFAAPAVIASHNRTRGRRTIRFSTTSRSRIGSATTSIVCAATSAFARWRCAARPMASIAFFSTTNRPS